MLSGTKYGVQQSRGRFGLGAKMALIWSKMSTAVFFARARFLSRISDVMSPLPPPHRLRACVFTRSRSVYVPVSRGTPSVHPFYMDES